MISNSRILNIIKGTGGFFWRLLVQFGGCKDLFMLLSRGSNQHETWSIYGPTKGLFVAECQTRVGGCTSGLAMSNDSFQKDTSCWYPQFAYIVILDVCFERSFASNMWCSRSFMIGDVVGAVYICLVVSCPGCRLDLSFNHPADCCRFRSAKRWNCHDGSSWPRTFTALNATAHVCTIVDVAIAIWQLILHTLAVYQQVTIINHYQPLLSSLSTLINHYDQPCLTNTSAITQPVDASIWPQSDWQAIHWGR